MKNLLLLITFASISILGISQTKISGVINDEKGIPLIGATVQVKGTSIGAVTNQEGKFSLETDKAEGVLVVSFIGYKTVEEGFTGSQQVKVNLELSQTSLDDVVVIGYGSARKRDITGAVSSVTNLEKIENRPVNTIQDFLQGSIAGVTVQQQGGDPTKQATVTIRGTGTLNDEEVLWVVDGMPYYGGTLNPNDIESISILKDGASKAIYGAQTSGGVILVTTKSGKQGKMSVSVNASTGISQATNLPTPLTAEEQNRAYNTAADNSGAVHQDGHNAELNPWGAVTRTNWIDEIFRNAQFYNTSVSLSGGNKKGIYSTSFNYLKKEGVLLGTSSERLGLRLKSEYHAFNKLTIGQNLYITNEEAIGTNTSSGYSGVIINAIYMPSAAPVYDEDRKFHGVAPEGSEYAGIYGDVYNPVALLLRPTTTNPVNTVDANFYGEYKITDGLTYRSSFTLNHYNWEYKEFTPKIPEVGRTTDMNYLAQSWKKRNKWIWDNQFSYSKQFGKHKIDLTGIYSAQYTDYEYNLVNAEDFAREEEWYHYLENANSITSYSSTANEDAFFSLIGRAMYNYNRKYYLTASIRRDQTSRLATENNSDIFPSVSAGWVLSEESFLNDISWLEFLKLRASWGQIGNIQSVGYYAYNVPMASQRPTIGEEDAQEVSGYYVKQQSNSGLIWETSESYNGGLDLTLFDGKFEFTGDFYQKNTNDLILKLPADAHYGVSDGPTKNVGSVKNTGFELTAGYKESINGFNFAVHANIARVQNELLDLDGYVSDIVSHNDNIRGQLYPYQSAVGEELYSYYLYTCEGTFKSEAEINAHKNSEGGVLQPNAEVGDLKFADSNGDGVLDGDDRTYKGNAFPDFTYGFNLSAEYKGFDISLTLQGVSGAKIFNGYKYSTYNASLQGYNLDNRVLDAWSGTNPGSDIPKLRVDDPNNNFGTISDWYLEDGSYLRIKNLTIGYSVPQSVVSKIASGASLKIYVSGENLFTFTNYSGMDPEVGKHGLDVGTYPVSRTFIAGVSLNF